MKIGILTHFYKSTNYGGVLQAYALCKFLNKNGHSAKQILYEHNLKQISCTKMSVFSFITKVIRSVNKRISRKLYFRLNQKVKSRQEVAFSDFREYVPHTLGVYRQDSIKSVLEMFDAFITGSDQVWNPMWYDPTYMLCFVDKDMPKFSYAASIGLKELDRKQELIFREHLSKFSGISVREKTAADLLKPIIDKKVNVCVDPTLLLTAEEWDEVDSKKFTNQKYVFLYLLGNDNKVRKLAKKFADSRGLKLIMIPDLLGIYRKRDRIHNAEIVLDATPGDFISLIKNAEYILTDSFHACVFSIIYHKEFYAFSRSGTIKMNSRIVDLLEMFDCLDHFCGDNRKRIKFVNYCPAINYAKSSDVFVKVKKDSVQYLESSLRV